MLLRHGSMVRVHPRSPLGSWFASVLAFSAKCCHTEAAHPQPLSEIRLFDEAVRPDRLHQLVFGDDLPAFLDQHQEHFKRLRSQRDEIPAPRSTLLWTSSRNSPYS